MPPYALLMTFFGALRGANRQRPGITATLVGYWVIGLPLGALLGPRLRWPTPLIGVWMGNVVALLIASSWVLYHVFGKINWLAVQRVNLDARLLGDESDAREVDAVRGCQETPSSTA